MRRSIVTFCILLLTSASALAGEFRPGPVPQHGFGRYRVTVALEDGDDAFVVARQLAATYRGRLEPYAEEGFTGFVVLATERSARMLSGDPRVVVVEEIVPQPPRTAPPAHVPPVRTPLAENGNETWTTGTYQYDGSGNIKAIGTDAYEYDAFGRLKTGHTAGVKQTFTYDRFGNIQTITTADDVATQTKPCFTAASRAKNQIAASGTDCNVVATYDAAGNMLTANSDRFTYDSVNMVTDSFTGEEKVYLYTPSDERIATYNLTAGTQEWTVRSGEGKVLRRFTRSASGTWSWSEDYIYRDGALLAAETPQGRLQFHLDHLGTPRLITNGNGTRVALHAYHPFGAEATSPTQNAERMKFTGHERDSRFLDYMHARYYSSAWGRFLSVDPVLQVGRAMESPQLWNRYSYALNNPMVYTDPTGETVYLVTYTTGNASGDNELKRSAETLKAEIEGRKGFDPTKDTVLLRGVETKQDFAAAVKEATALAPKFGAVGNVSLFSHAGRNDGPTFQYDTPQSHQFTKADLGKLRVNWESGATAWFYGCNTGLKFAQSFANAQGVTSYGYAGYANFSHNPNHWVMPFNLTGPIYLIHTDGGSNGGLKGSLRKWLGFAPAIPMVERAPQP